MPMSLQRPGDSLLVGLGPGIAEPSQRPRIPLGAHDGLDNFHAGLAGDVADDVLELHVHLSQRFLHVLDVVGGILHQHAPLTQVAPQPPDLPLGPEGRRKQPVGVQLLEPLTVQHVCLASRHVLDALGSTSITRNPRSSNTPNRGIQ